MEYVLPLFSDGQVPAKARLSRLRHLDSLFFFLLILVLLLFQAFQHRQLRDELKASRPDYLLEELLQDRLPQLERQIEELRTLVGDQHSQVEERLRENKRLVVELGRELGLPFERTEPQKQNSNVQQELEVKKEGSGYEVIEIEQSNEEEQAEDIIDSSEDASEPESFAEEEVIIISKPSHCCNYLEYLAEGSQPQLDQAWSSPKHESQRINVSSYARRSGLELHRDDVQQLKKAVELGTVVLVGVLVVVILLLLTCQKPRKPSHAKGRSAKGKQAQQFMTGVWRAVCSREQQRLKEWKPEKDLLVL